MDKSRQRRSGTGKIGPAAGLVSIAVLLAGLMLGVSAGFILRGPASAQAQRLGLIDARAKADLASVLLASELPKKGEQDKSRLAAAERLAAEALGRDVLIAEAWRTLAMAREAQGAPSAKVRPLVEFAHALSRRDLLTQTWMFQAYARDGRLPAALHEVDLAMRRSPKGRQVILPLLTPALGDSALRRSLQSSLAQGAVWRRDFLVQLGQTPPPEKDIVTFVNGLPGSVIRSEAETLRQTAAALVLSGRFVAAQAIFNRVGNRRELVRNSGFEAENKNPPFDWELQATATYDATQSSGVAGHGNSALFLRTHGAQVVQVARQILFLKPGAYTLSAIAGVEFDTRPLTTVTLGVSCAASGGGQGEVVGALEHRLTTSDSGRSASFKVPRDGCVAQWLTISIAAAPDSDGGAWIDDVQIAAG